MNDIHVPKERDLSVEKVGENGAAVIECHVDTCNKFVPESVLRAKGGKETNDTNNKETSPEKILESMSIHEPGRNGDEDKEEIVSI